MHKRTCLSRSRMGLSMLYALKLAATKRTAPACGRHGIPVNMRVCRLCSLSKVEDEIHFLLECPLYLDLRRRLLSVAEESLLLNSLSIEEKFQAIMSACCELVCKALGESVWAAFLRRRRQLKLLFVMKNRKK